MAMDALGVVDVSVFQLVQELCQQLVVQQGTQTNTLTFQAPTKVAPWSPRDNRALTGRLVRLFYDRVLLRRWEWFGVSRQRSTIASPACRCMAHSHQLVGKGRHQDARRLIEAVNCLSETNTLSEREALFTFLSLLAGPVLTNIKSPLIVNSAVSVYVRN